MATASTLKEQATCPICSGPYKEARKLPGCSHSFCEACILTYVLNLKRDAKLEMSFQCPVCRLPSDAPDNGDVTLEWIQSMGKMKATSSKQHNAASELHELCSECSCLEKYTKAKYYCVDCKESFCEPCSKALHSFKVTSNHALIEVDSGTEKNNVHEQALMMLKKFLTCSKHPSQSVAFYCDSEKQFYCSECAVNNHYNCTKKKIEELANKHEETTCMSKTLVSSLKKLFDHYQSFIKTIKEHDQENKSEPDKLLNEFFTLKRKVIDQFDILEESLKAESKAMCKEIAIKNLDEIDELKEVGQRLSVVTYLIENLADKIPAELACVCLHEAGNILKHIKEETAERGQSRNKTRIMLKTENVLNTLLELGPNEINQIASAQMVDETIPLPEYDDLCLRNCDIKKMKTNTVNADYLKGFAPNYNGILFLPDNKMILSDTRFDSVCFTDEISKRLSSYRFDDKMPTHIGLVNVNGICATAMTNNTIAVSVADKNRIYFLSVSETLEYKSEMSCKNTPVAIHGLRNSDIAVLWKSPWAFGIITLTGGSYHEKVYFDKDKNQKDLITNGFMAVDEARSHVILPSERDHTIYCYDFEANQIFAYHDTKIARPRGVAIDGDGYIYVCEEKQGTIIVLSQSGNLSRIIKDELPTRPLGIGFKEDGKTFAVTQFGPRSADVHFLSLTDSFIRCDTIRLGWFII